MHERKATVLIVDAPSGRSAALAQSYSKSSEVEKILVASGNGLIAHNCLPKTVETFPNVSHKDWKAIRDLVNERRPDLIDLAQEDILSLPLADFLRVQGKIVFGPNKEATALEWDKIHARYFMKFAGIPTPNWIYFDSEHDGITYLNKSPFKERFFVKATGLAEGKGAIGAKNTQEAIDAVRRMRDFPNRAGESFLIEEWVGGPKAEEFSAFFMGINNCFYEIGYAQDHKQVNDNDEGENTGGMGCVSPTGFVSEKLRRIIRQEIVNRAAVQLGKDDTSFNGILYIGGIYDPDLDKQWVIEFNTRWGDPEAEVIMPSMQNDYFRMAWSVAKGENYEETIRTDGRIRVSVAGVAMGYPGNYERVKGRKILGLDRVLRKGEVSVYGAGIIEEDGLFYVSGGRIFHLVGDGDTVEEARSKVYDAISQVYILGNRTDQNLLHFRNDIGLKEMQREK